MGANRERHRLDTQRSLAESHPLLRLGTPENVARAALFLASEESSWITGIIVDIAGRTVLRRNGAAADPNVAKRGYLSATTEEILERRSRRLPR
jgi:NAD(P)-dependent dehydrogenase (short-subunit alcohol dehydrogenase family)